MVTDIASKNMSQNKNIGLLSVSQAIVGSQQALIMSVGALVGITLAPSPAFATVPITSMIFGLAVSAGSAAILSHRLGRKKAFIFGAVLSVLAGILATIGIFLSSFIIFCVALFIGGASAAIGQQYRFAAADSVPEEKKGKAISWVLGGGVLAGFVGPALARYGREWFVGAEFAGSFIALSGLALLGIFVLSLTKLAPAQSHEQTASATPLREIVKSPRIFVPIITGIVAYGLMTFIMVAAPLAMVMGTKMGAMDSMSAMGGMDNQMAGMHSKEAAIMAIQWHIIFMFAPSFFVGAIIAKIGSHAVIGIGLMFILACSFLALNGVSFGHFSLAMILLGIGWNFGFIGSTTLLAKGYLPQDAARVQALNEQLVFGTMAVVSISSGILLNTIGWQAINVIAIPFALGAIALLAWNSWRSN